MKEFELAYFAGFFDGEGCVRLAKQERPERSICYGLQAFVTNQNLTVLKWLKYNFGGIIHKRKDGSHCYNWYVTATKAAKFLEAIKPYSLVKFKQIDLALSAQKLLSSRRGVTSKRPEEETALLESVRAGLSSLKKVDEQAFCVDLIQ